MTTANYVHRTVRDLAWACFSPPLLHTTAMASGEAIDNVGLKLTPARRDWLAQLDREPQKLNNFLAQPPTRRLGLHFERLWQFFLHQDPAVELLAHNLPVREAKRTIGEFDCLYYCQRRDQVFHLELAVKFFLGHRQTSTPAGVSQLREWWGPNTRDRLDRKVAHLMDRQIRLSEHPAARQQLLALGIAQPALEVELKGYLFNNHDYPLATPEGFNGARPLEQWLRIDRLPAALAANAGYAILPRLFWLSPVRVTDGVDQLTAAQLQRGLSEHFDTQCRPRLIAEFDDEGCERRRFFVTGRDWPEDH